MKDYEANTLKAFVFALANQAYQLDGDTQSQLNQISTNLFDNIVLLDNIASKHPTISQRYLEAWESLDPSQERNKGFVPASEDKKRSFIPLEDSPKLNKTDPEEFLPKSEALLLKLKKIDHNSLLRIVKSILQALNSVEAAQKSLASLPY
jgi:hypothetical protein